MLPEDDLDLYHKAFALVYAYAMCVEPFDHEQEARFIAAQFNTTSRIQIRQLMFALAYHEFGNGNQEEFFRLVQKHNKIAEEGFHLGPKKFSSSKSLRAYLKTGQAQIGRWSRKALRNYQEVAQWRLGLGFSTKFSAD
jgi:hypothetical protein